MVLKNSVVSEEAKRMYMNRMNNFLVNASGTSTPTTLELRQRHAEYKFEALDYFRVRSTPGRDGRSWKLERDLEATFDDYRNRNRKRKLGRSDSVEAMTEFERFSLNDVPQLDQQQDL